MEVKEKEVGSRKRKKMRKLAPCYAFININLKLDLFFVCINCPPSHKLPWQQCFTW